MKYLYILIFTFSIFISQNIFKEKKKIKTILRKLIKLDSNDKSIKTCKNSPSYLLNYYKNSDEMNFDEWINKDNAHYLFEMARVNQKKNNTKNEDEIHLLNKEKNEYYNNYLSTRLGLYFIFVGIAGFALIYWALFWVCLKCPICCYYPENDEKILKILYLILVYVLYGFIIILLILSFIYSYQYNKRLNGIKCALERNYYNIKEGQLKKDNLTWPGFDKIKFSLNFLSNLTNSIIEDNSGYEKNNEQDIIIYLLKSFTKKYNELLNYIDNSNKNNFKYFNEYPIYLTNYSKLIEQYLNDLNQNIISTVKNFEGEFKTFLEQIINILYPFINKSLYDKLNNLKKTVNNINSFSTSFEEYEDKIINTFFKFQKHLKLFGVTLNLIFNIIYMILISGIITFLSLYIFWNQKKIFRTILLILWNICMAFIIYYFLLSGFLGIVNLGAKDSIGLFQTIFSEYNLKYFKSIFESKNLELFNECIYGNGDFKNLINLNSENMNNLNDLINIRDLYFFYYNITNQINVDNINNLLRYYFFVIENYLYSFSKNKDDYLLNYTNYTQNKEQDFRYIDDKTFDKNKDSNNNIYDFNEIIITKLNQTQTELKVILKNISDYYDKNYINNNFSEYLENSTNIFSNMDCNFIRNDLNATYKILLDFSEKDNNMVYIISFLSFFSLFFVNFLIMTLIRHNYEEEIEIDENKKIGSYRKNINSISSISSDEEEYNQKDFKLRKRKESSIKYNKMSIFSKKSNSEEDNDD